MTLSKTFTDALIARPFAWKGGVEAEFTFMRTYAWERAKLPHLYGEGASGMETWADCCIRVVNATKARAEAHGLDMPIDFWEGMAEAMHAQKWSPPGRGLRFMGTRYVEERCGTPLFNCAAVSTSIEHGGIAPAMRWAFMALALGAGVGYDTVATEAIVPFERTDEPFVVSDDREGWADALQHVYLAARGLRKLQPLDVSGVREKGTPVKGLGGVASGPGPLLLAYERLVALCERYAYRNTDSAFIVDLFDIQALAVLSGGTRRSAMIALGEPGDVTFQNLKVPGITTDEEWSWRWASNHSVRNPTPADHEGIAKACVLRGEPAPIYIEKGAKQLRFRPEQPRPRPTSFPEILCNPCAEQLLAHREMCNIAETVPARCSTLAEFKRLAAFAFIYCKVVTTYDTFDDETNEVQRAHRRVGVGVTGFVEMLERHGRATTEDWLHQTYRYIKRLDIHVSTQMGIPTSIRKTTVKPSGTVSLVLGCTPGVHYDHAPHYIRRVRFSADSRWAPILERAGYHVEPDVAAPNTLIVSFPTASPTKVCKGDVSLRQKLEDVALLQRAWSDNMVSCTADYDPETEGGLIASLLDEYGGTRIKSVSFLARDAHTYAQAPYETITAEKYAELLDGVVPLVYDDDSLDHEVDDKFCDGASCQVSFA